MWLGMEIGHVISILELAKENHRNHNEKDNEAGDRSDNVDDSVAVSPISPYSEDLGW